MNFSVIKTSTANRHLHPENTGELILFYESGYVPPKREENLIFPILKKDDVEG